MTNTTTVGVSASISAALLTLLIGVDARMEWGFGAEMCGAFLVVLFAVPAFIVAAVRYWNRLRAIAHEKADAAEIAALRGAVANPYAQIHKDAERKASGENAR